MRHALFLASLIGWVLCALVVGHAKGPTVKLTLSGSSLASPIEITTPAALVHVYSDDFIGAPAVEPDAAWPRYQLAFHVLPNGKRDAKVMYVITYVVDPAGNGFVYLPGNGEEHYWLNASTILREGKEGRWHGAAVPWSKAVSAVLE